MTKSASSADDHESIRRLTDDVTEAIRKLSGQEYVPEYAQVVKKRMKEQNNDTRNEH